MAATIGWVEALPKGRHMTAVFDKRRSVLAFWLGCAAVAGGVLTHLPMFLMGRGTHYVLAGMPMGAPMIGGMFAIVAGIALAGFGLLPDAPSQAASTVPLPAPPENAPLTLRHWSVAGVLALALIIDIMKPASLGFVTPGMRAEYGIGVSTVAWLPFAALAGTALGSVVWGALADLYGRRAAILLSSVMFIGTAICGAMPSFGWNVAMCFLMGCAAGGMLPVAYALLAEIMPTRHRGWSLVLIGGIGAIGGFFAASGLSALLQPTFGWRVMWLLNFPTGLVLVLLSPLLPESARFLQRLGRTDEARATLAGFGITGNAFAGADGGRHDLPPQTYQPSASAVLPASAGLTAALTMAALAWSLVNFGVLLWLPSALVGQGQSVAAASALIARSTLIATPSIVVSTWLYSRWSTRGCVIVMLAITILGLAGLALRFSAHIGLGSVSFDTVVIIIGSSGVIAVLLPYAAENYAVRVRARATGWVAGCTKLGGLLAQALGVLGLAPPIAVAAAATAVPGLMALLLLARYGQETRLRDLRELEPAPTSTAALM